MNATLTLGLAGFAFAAAGLAAPAHAVPAPVACSATHVGICFFLNDAPVTSRALGIPAATGSVAFLPDCERWPDMMGARRDFRGTCSETPDAPASYEPPPTFDREPTFPDPQ